MATWLKQSTAVDLPIGPFLDSTDGNTQETALTITQPDIRLKKNGGAWAQKSAAQTLSHEEAGWYEVSLSTTDTDTLGHLILAVHESGALPVWREFMVVSANVYDSLIGGGDTLDVQVTGMGANTVTASALATDAVTEIQSGLATSAALDAVDNFIDTEIADIQARLPAALVGGRIDASVGAMAANTLTASALATDAVTEIATAVAAPTASTIAEAVLESEIAVADDVSAAGTPTVRRRLRQLWQDNVKR
jgi:hypothetical protein